jgi:hypothetical protein
VPCGRAKLRIPPVVWHIFACERGWLRGGQFRNAAWCSGATIARMAKFKPVKPKRKTAPVPQGGLPCVILVLSAMVLLMLFIYFAMKYANG